MGRSDQVGIFLKVERVSYRYRRTERPAVDDLSFATGQGTVLGIVGPNGSGKTTLFRLLLGFARADSGEVRIADLDAASYRRRFGIGYLPESVLLPPDVTALELAMFVASLAGFNPATAREEISRQGEVLDIGDVLGKRTRHLSHGYRQRVGLLLTILGDPRLVLLDEPANGLDPDSVGVLRSLLRGLRRRGTTVIVSSHNLLELQRVCDEVLLLSQGRLLGGTTRKELAESPDIFVVQLGPPDSDRDVDWGLLNRLGGVRFAADEYAFPNEEAARSFANALATSVLVERRASDLEYLLHSLLQRSARTEEVEP